MFLSGKLGQKQTLLAKKGKKMFLAGKPGQKQTLLAKKGKIIPGWEKARTLRMLAGEKGC